MLNTQLASVANEDLTDELWQKVPMIISENTVKDAINTKATLAFAERTNQAVHWFEAIDMYHGTKVTDPDLREHLLAQPSGKTGQWLRRFPLVLGMPVIINQNFDVEGGLVNRSFGYLKEYRSQQDKDRI